MNIGIYCVHVGGSSLHCNLDPHVKICPESVVFALWNSRMVSVLDLGLFDLGLIPGEWMVGAN